MPTGLSELRSYTKENLSSSLTFHRIVLLVLIISAAWLRIRYLGELSLWHDEAISANAALSILENGIPNFPSGYVYWHHTPQLVLSAASAGLLGVSEFSLRMPSAIAGTLTIALTYVIGKEFYNKDVGLVSSSIITFSLWHIAWSMQVRMYALHLLFYTASIFMIYRLEKDFTKRNLAILALLVLLSISSHLTSIILPLIASIYILTFKFNNISLDYRQNASKTLIGLLSLLSYVVYVKREAVNLLVQSTSHLEYYSIWLSNNFLWPLVTGALGLGINIRRDLKTAFLTFLAVVPVLYVYFFHISGANNRYILVILPFVALWTALTIDTLLETLFESFSRYQLIKNSAIILFIILIGISTVGNFSDYRDVRPVYENREIYGFVEQEYNETDTLITSSSPSAIYYLDTPDYQFSGALFGVDSSMRNGVDEYSGAAMITGTEDMSKALNKSDSGWIVMNEYEYELLSDEMKKVFNQTENRKAIGSMIAWSW